MAVNGASDEEYRQYVSYANKCNVFPGGAVIPYSLLEWVSMGRPKGPAIGDGKWPAPREDLPKVSDASHRS